MCMQWMACLCWRDTKSPSVAIAVFALVTSLMQIAIAIAIFTSSPTADDMKIVTNPLYITLAVFDFVVVLLSILMLVGYERSDACHHWTRFCWVIWMFIYILYESAINIFVFYWAFSPSIPPTLMNVRGAVIVFIVYWVCKEIMLFIGWLFIVSHLCYGESLSVNSSYPDQTLHVVNNDNVVQINNNNNGGGVVRPTSTYQGAGGGVYMGYNNYQVQARYM